MSRILHLVTINLFLRKLWWLRVHKMSEQYWEFFIFWVEAFLNVASSYIYTFLPTCHSWLIPSIWDDWYNIYLHWNTFFFATAIFIYWESSSSPTGRNLRSKGVFEQAWTLTSQLQRSELVPRIMEKVLLDDRGYFSCMLVSKWFLNDAFALLSPFWEQ